MKKELLELSNILRDTAAFFGSHDSMIITASVIVQNMAANAKSWESKDFTPGLDLLRKYSEFRKDHHVLAWAYSEANMIIDGHFMSQMENQNEQLISYPEELVP